MKPLHINEIAKAIKALDYESTHAHDTISSVAFDSRLLQPNSLFVPLVSERDGHDFADKALEKGASATLWSSTKKRPPEGLIAIYVEDTLEALKDLARYYLNMIQPKVIAITGSAGKTTTKDLTAAALSSVYCVHKTAANFNNEIGVPVTILSMPEGTEVLVLEMGMNHAGEITKLSQLAQPDIAVITMIGESHIEYLGSRENIAKAKLEILDGLKKEGTLIYPGSEELLTKHIPDHLSQTILKVGLDEQEDIYAINETIQSHRSYFYTNLSPEVELSIPLSGGYNIQNALMACGVAYKCGLSVEQIKTALSESPLTSNRTEWVQGIENTRILDDTYNANPTAMKAVITNFGKIESTKMSSRKLLVLGDMLELGEFSWDLHASVATVIVPDIFQEVYLYGTQIKALYEALIKDDFPEERVHYFPEDKREMITLLKEHLVPDDEILVKGSHGMALLDVVDALRLPSEEPTTE